MYVENWELKQDLPRQNPVPERQDFFFFFWYVTLTKDDKNPDNDKNPESLDDLY